MGIIEFDAESLYDTFFQQINYSISYSLPSHMNYFPDLFVGESAVLPNQDQKLQDEDVTTANYFYDFY